jgi:hypothetical protein
VRPELPAARSGAEAASARREGGCFCCAIILENSLELVWGYIKKPLLIDFMMIFRPRHRNGHQQTNISILEFLFFVGKLSFD